MSCIAYSPRTRCLLAGSKSGHVVAYDERAFHKPISCVRAHDSAVKCLHAVGNLHATGCGSGEVKVWRGEAEVDRMEDFHPRTSIFRHYGSGTTKVRMSGDLVFSCGADGTLKMTSISV